MEDSLVSYISLSHILKNSISDAAVILILMIILVPSALADYRAEKIPNVFSMSGWILGPVLHFLFSGVDGALQSGLGFLLLFGLTFPLWIIRWFGAADVKLIASVGAIVGGTQALTVLLGIVVTGFVMSLALVTIRGDLLLLLRVLYHRLVWWKGEEITGHADSVLSSKNRTIPYGIPIAFGTLLTILYTIM